MPSDRPPTLAELDGPQAPSIVAGLGAALFAALEADGRVGAALTAAGVRLDEQGRPELGERGERLAELDEAEQSYVAPEVWAGATPSTTSDLYGLGVLLHRLATGQLPRFNPGRPGPPPPPSTLRPDLPAALDRAILALLDPDPARRPAALADLHDEAGPLPDLRRLMRAGPASTGSVGVGEVKYTTTPGSAPRAAALDAPLRTILVVPPAEAAALPPSALSAIAGRTGAPLEAVESLVAADRPLPVAVRASGTSEPTLPAQALSPGGLGTAAAAAGLTAVGGAGLVAGLVAAVFSVVLGLGLAGVALVPLLAGVVFWVLWIRGRAAYAAAAATWRELAGLADAAAAHPLTGEAWGRLSAVRVALASADLPEAAEIDLRGGLRRVEDGLVRLGERWTATREARDAQGGDTSPLDDRLAALGDEAARLEHGLSELALLVGRATHAWDEDQGADAVEVAMDRVLAAAKLAADAVSDDDDDRRRRAGARQREGA